MGGGVYEGVVVGKKGEGAAAVHRGLYESFDSHQWRHFAAN